MPASAPGGTAPTNASMMLELWGLQARLLLVAAEGCAPALEVRDDPDLANSRSLVKALPGALLCGDIVWCSRCH